MERVCSQPSMMTWKISTHEFTKLYPKGKKSNQNSRTMDGFIRKVKGSDSTVSSRYKQHILSERDRGRPSARVLFLSPFFCLSVVRQTIQTTAFPGKTSLLVTFQKSWGSKLTVLLSGNLSRYNCKLIPRFPHKSIVAIGGTPTPRALSFHHGDETAHPKTETLTPCVTMALLFRCAKVKTIQHCTQNAIVLAFPPFAGSSINN